MSHPARSRLARAHGIELEYRDSRGRIHRATDETLVTLLRALGVEAGSDAAVERALAAWERRDWLAALPPVVVARQDARSVSIPLTVPADDERRAHGVRLVEESGAAHERSVVPARLSGGEVRTIDGRRLVRRTLTLTELPAPGYHRLEIVPEGGAPARVRLIVTPAGCHRPSGLRRENRIWGPAVQTYALRSGRDWGAGDFTALRRLVEVAADAGAGIVGVNPLHALFAARPEQFGPYGPSSRSFLNPLYVDVEAIPELAESDAARERVESADHRARRLSLRDRDLVDWPAVAGLKREVLEILWRHFRAHHADADTPRGRAFRAFREARGEELRAFATFEALEEHFRGQDEAPWGWPAWPEPYRRPDGVEVRRFADEHPDRIGFFEYCQWIADEQLAAVGARSWELGLAVGLYQDLAVGVDRGGFEGWWYGGLWVEGASVGAPPDDFNLAGQDWGLPPLNPERVREQGYEPFARCLRAAMRHAGAVRIDHVMALMRLFWVPAGGTPADGAYVRYPLDDLLGIVALESVRNECLVIGEDLGTVPDEIRARLREIGVLGCRLLPFSKDEADDFEPPAAYPRETLVAISNHDLPTLAGWWQGRDIALRTELDLFPTPEEREAQIVARAGDRTRLLLALEREGLLPGDAGSDLSAYSDMTPELMAAVHRYVARTPSMVLAVQLEDVLGEESQVNVPGTTGEHPNWQRRLPIDVDSLADDPRFRSVAAAIRAERGVSPRGGGGGRARIPSATYRLQLHAGFGFDDAAAIVPYLAALGVSHVYCSPYLHARAGSTHGYDVIDHGTLNPELGGREAFDRFARALAERGMGQVADVVPNHMGVGSDNEWWMHVLEHGPASPHADFFDVDWRPFAESLHGKVLLPVLEDHFGAVLERGLLRLEFEAASGRLALRYHERRLPVDPETYPIVLSHGLERLRAALRDRDDRRLEFESLVEALDGLPARDDTARREARLRDAGLGLRRLARLAAASREVCSFVEENVALFNGTAGEPASFDRLDRLLAAQAYRLAYWRVAADEINYRRFFDINDLAGLRMERSEVFDATHRLLLDLVWDGQVDGLRIDHPDGLYDPAGYYRRLADAIAGGPATDDERREPPAWVVVEKILAPHERVPDDWRVHGTTGYDFLAAASGLLVDAGAEKAIDRVYRRFTGRRDPFEELVADCKRLILRSALSSELTVLADELDRVAGLDRRTRDFTRERLRDALTAVIARFPVYRTYVTEAGPSEQDRRYIDWALAQARQGNPAFDTSIFDFLHRVLTLDAAADRPDGYRRRLAAFAGRFQQLTGPVMAKGLEDTAGYIENRLLCLNEVGAEPTRFGISPAAFHHANRERADRWPHAMLTTSTHDTKRSEDVRARLAVLSEIPDDWAAAVQRFGLLNRSRRSRVDGAMAPSRNDEYAIYQSLLGIWPVERPDADGLAGLAERVEAWAVKAVREAKVHGSWLNPNESYEAAVRRFVRALLDPGEGNPFLAELEPLARQVATAGVWNSLSQVALKLTSPGVPDLYQGAESWILSLVDPDNRRPVDFAARRGELADLATAVERDGPLPIATRLAAAPADGRLKLFVTWRLLRLRRELEAVFRSRDYTPLGVAGEDAERAVAYARAADGQVVVVAVPRLIAGRLPADRAPSGADAWRDAAVELPRLDPDAVLTDAVTGAELTLEPGEADGARLRLDAAPLPLVVGVVAGRP